MNGTHNDVCRIIWLPRPKKKENEGLGRAAKTEEVASTRPNNGSSRVDNSSVSKSSAVYPNLSCGSRLEPDKEKQLVPRNSLSTRLRSTYAPSSTTIFHASLLLRRSNSREGGYLLTMSRAIGCCLPVKRALPRLLRPLLAFSGYWALPVASFDESGAPEDLVSQRFKE